MRYPRDPTLDPQLVWKGKDEQDAPRPRGAGRPDLHPGDDRPARARRGAPRRERGPPRPSSSSASSAPYSDLTFEEKVDFYRHPGKWSNRMILGDSLLVMTSLAEKEGLKGQVQTIYIDPPYGIKFGSNWQVSTRKRDVRDGKDTDLTRQPEQVRAYRDTWELGIHSYLAYLRDRLVVARETADRVRLDLRPDRRRERAPGPRRPRRGLRRRRTSLPRFAFGRQPALGGTLLPVVTDYLLWYAQRSATLKYRQLYKLGRFGRDRRATSTTWSSSPTGATSA